MSRLTRIVMMAAVVAIGTGIALWWPFGEATAEAAACGDASGCPQDYVDRWFDVTHITSGTDPYRLVTTLVPRDVPSAGEVVGENRGRRNVDAIMASVIVRTDAGDSAVASMDMTGASAPWVVTFKSDRRTADRHGPRRRFVHERGHHRPDYLSL